MTNNNNNSYNAPAGIKHLTTFGRFYGPTTAGIVPQTRRPARDLDQLVWQTRRPGRAAQDIESMQQSH